MSKSKVKSPEISIVSPMIEVEGDPHPLKDLEKQAEMPTLKSVGVARLSPNSKDFISYVITSRGSEVLNIEVSEPNLRAISNDEAKVSFVTTFLNDDGALPG